MALLSALQILPLLLTAFRCVQRIQSNDLFIHISKSQRWVNELSNFNFRIHYKTGIENVAADSLRW